MIARKSALIIFMQLANGIIGYIGLKFIASYMDPWEYGVVGFAYGFVALFSSIGRLGFDQAHIKKISEGRDLGTCIGTFIATKVGLAGIFASFTVVSIIIWKYIFNRSFESPFHEQAVYIMITYFVLATLTQTMISTFNAKKEIAKAQLPLFFYTIVRVIVTIIVAFNDLGTIALTSTYILGEIFHFFIALLLFRNYPIRRPSFKFFKEYSKFAFPLAISSSAYIFMTNIDKVFIQLFWGAQQVGEYFASYNLSHYLILFSNAIGLLLFPTISEYHAKKNIEKIKILTIKSERYISMIVFPIVFLVVFLAEPIIVIVLSSKYLPALLILQILPFFALIDVLSRPYLSKLQGMNMPNITRNRVLIMVFLNVILNIILIPKDIKSIGIRLIGLGGTGAAISTVISYSIGLIYIRLHAWKLTRISGSIRILFHAFSAIIMGIILHYLSNIYLISRWYHLISFAILGLGIYLGVLYLFHEFTKDDFNIFLDTINIKKMFEYIKEEIRKK